MLSDEQKKSIANAILENIGQYRCPICGDSKFSIIEDFGLHMMRSLSNPTNVSWGIPYVMLVCGKCGYMSQHNAISLGVLDPESAQTLLSSLEKITKQSK